MADARSEINSLQELFHRSAKTFPDNIAVTFSADAVESIMYRDLSNKVKKLSSIFAKIFSQNEVVGIYSRDCLNLPALLLAVMDASAAFYPISTTIQSRKVIENINHRSIRYILVDNALLQNIMNFGEYDSTMKITESKLLQEFQFTLLKVASRNQPCVVNWSTDVAYVMQTSGTTGDPKAVFVPHSCIVPNILHLSSIFEVNSRDVVYLASPYTFDPFIVQMFLAFHNGAELLITTQATKLIPKKLCRILFDQHKVTILQPTPSLLYYIGENLINDKILSENSSLSVLAIGGESCPPLSTLRKWKHAKCKTRLYNVYGITEVSSWATCSHITDDKVNAAVNDQEIAVSTTCELGPPLLHTELIVYGDNGDLVSENGIGHLQIGGKDRQCLVEGESEESVPIMRDSGDIVEVKDGHMWYVGRSDNQIKRFGHRINLDYIEKTVRECMDVTSCALVLQPVSTGGGALLHLCVVPNLPTERSSDDMQRYRTALCKQIRDILPRPSQPDQVHLVCKFPMTDHGKIDKREVLRIVMDRNSHCNNTVSVNVALSQMWQNSIGQNLSENTIDKESLRQSKGLLHMSGNNLLPHIPSVKSSDMFMLQGGDSLQAVYLAEQIEKWIDKHCDHPRDLSMMFEIITNEPFSSLVSYVEGILKNCTSPAPRSVTVDQRTNANSRRPLNTDLEPIAKMSKSDDNPTNIDRNMPFFQKTVSVNENRTCACFLRRGSEKFVCSLCENNPACLISSHITLSISLTKEMPLQWTVYMEKCIDASPLIVPSCLTRKGLVLVGSHSYLFMAVSLSDGAILWRTRLGGRIESSACLSYCGKLVAVGCYDGKLYILARDNGQIIWTYQTQDIVKSSPCLDLRTGLIWLGSHDGYLYGLDIHQKMCKMCVKCMEGSCFSSPAVSYDPHCVYIGTLAGSFLCVDALSGKIKWFKRFEKPIFSSPFIQDDKVFVVTVNGCLKCLSHYGDEVWELRTDVPIFSTPVGITSKIAPIASGVFLASHGHKVIRVSSEGKCVWSTTVDGPAYATPCFVSGDYDLSRIGISTPQLVATSNICIVVVTTKGTMYFLAGNDGSILNTFSVPGEVFSSPTIVGGNIVLGSRNNYLYCFKL